MSLFSRQQLSDEMLKRLCQTLEVPRHYLRLVGTAKGLVRGHLRILEPRTGGKSGESVWVDGMDPLEPRGHSISPICAHVLRVETMAQCIFVVEKETIFHRLLDEGFLEKQKPCILVTARGFPDVPTRYFLRHLKEACANPKFYVVVDFDPSGLLIAATYAFGPQKAWLQDDLTLPEAVPLLCTGGVQGAARFGLRRSDVLRLTASDTAKMTGLRKRLRQVGMDDDVLHPYLQGIIELSKGGVKYEIDALDKLTEFIMSAARQPCDQAKTDSPTLSC